MFRIGWMGLFLATLPLSGAGFARTSALEGSSLVDNLAACRGIVDSGGRLACYDLTAAKLAEAAAKHDIVVLDGAQVRKTKRSLFGFALPQLPLFGSDGKDGHHAEADFTEIQTKIVGVRSADYGKWTLVLAESGTWQTTEIDENLSPAQGDTIRIRRAALGSYLANIHGGRAVRIRRIG